MKRMHRTKDEFFLLQLFEIASLKGDPFQEVDVDAVGKAVGLGKRSIKNIVNTLAQTTFIKKGDEGMVYLTPHGLKLVHQLKEEGQ